jgi:hypothetical protein
MPVGEVGVAGVVVLVPVVVVALVEAAVVDAGDAAPPTGDVGLVGASVHAAVIAHARPSQVRTNLTVITQTSRAPAGDRHPGPRRGERVL